MTLPTDPDPFTEATLQQYLKALSGKGLTANTQGVWLQSGPFSLASNQGTTPLSAASLTKVATSLVALQNWGPSHQFETLVSATGPVENGVLQGDLVIQGGGDPMLVWEEAIALGNTLNKAGITRVTGNLVITGNFLMNFETDSKQSGEILKQAFDSKNWSGDAEYQYQTLPPGTPRPQLAIAGSVQVVTYGGALLPKQILLVRHRSLPLAQILKLMNIYSNNAIAESLATSLGGAQVVAQQAASLANVPAQEISLSNGSGLGVENRISPRAVCAMFAALQRSLQPYQLNVADLFPVSGIDTGTIDYRNIPKASIVKTGTLNEVSALAGVMPTRDRGLVWFAIINRGTNLDDLRNQQDVLLQSLIKRWGTVATPVSVAPNPAAQATAILLGDSSRNEVLARSAVEIHTAQ